jgi:hypothetical protein
MRPTTQRIEVVPARMVRGICPCGQGEEQPAVCVDLADRRVRRGYELVSDPDPDGFAPGAAFSDYDIEWMVRYRYFTPGTEILHRRSGVMYEIDGMGRMVRHG